MPGESLRPAESNGHAPISQAGKTDDTPEAVLEAALAEQRREWLAGKRAPVSEWLRRKPALASEPARAAELVYHEFTLRQEVGESPDWEDYLRRFPEYAGVLRGLRRADQIVEQALTPDELTVVPSARFGDFELLGELGRGGMGVVYKARQISLNRIVALKMLRAGEHSDEEGRRRFDGEAQAVARLRHPHIVQIYELGEADGRPFFAMEYVEGRSLADRLDGTPWPARQAAALVEPLAGAMHHAHEKGIVHRDLKPSNVLLEGPPDSPPERWVPKVTDFGLAKRLDAEGPSRTRVVGTPSYMAPEQAEGKAAAIDRRADVYGLGAILYELLTGRPPFRAESALETLRQVAESEPAAPRLLNPLVPRDLEKVCRKCLEKEPRQRYPTADALAEDLRRFLDGKPVRARPVGPLQRGWRWCRRRPAVASLLAAVALVAAVALAGLVSLYRHTVEAWSLEEAARHKSDDALKKAEDRDRRTRQILAAFVRSNHRPSQQSPQTRRGLSLGQLKQAAAHYEALLREEPGDIALQTALADVYAGASLLHYERWQLADDLAFGEKTLASWVPAVEAHPLPWHYHQRSAVNNIYLGETVPRLERGQFADALALSEKALGLWKQVAQSGDPGYRGSLAEAYYWKGILHRDGGEVGQALGAFRHACAVWGVLAEEQPTPDQRYNLARAQRLLCEVLYLSGRTDESFRLMAASQALLNRLRADQLGEKRLLDHLAQNYAWLGNVHEERGFQAEALGYYRQAYDLMKAWVGQRPGDGAARETLASYAMSLIRPEAVEPYYTEAVRPYDAACGAIARLVEEEPANRWRRHQLDMLYRTVAYCHERAGRPARTVAAWERYTQTLEGLAKRAPGEGFGLRLGPAYGFLAVCHAKAGDARQAVRAARRGFDILEALRPEVGPPATADQRFQWASQALGLAHPIRRVGVPEKALLLSEQSRHLLLGLVRESPQDLRYAFALFGAYEELGKAHVVLGRPDEALTAWLSGVGVMRRVVERAPASLGYRIRLAGRYLNLSRYLRERGRFAEAADWLLEREKLLPGDPLYLQQASREFALLAAAVGRPGAELSPTEQAQRQRYLRLSARPANEVASWTPQAQGSNP